MAGVDCLQAMICLAFLLLTAVHAHHPSMPEEEFVPAQSVEYRSLALEEMMSGEPFQTCGVCRCCSNSNGSNCVQTRCCYGIDCNIPGKPFGVCAFKPRTCGCGANNCNQQPSRPLSSSQANV